MLDPFRLRWRLGILAALAVTLLSVVPHINFWRTRGEQWQGSFYSYHPDEYAYAAYVNALIHGQPRRNDPMAGLANQPDAPLPESIMSIQFFPAYAIAIPARLMGVSTATAFILLTPISAFLSGLAIFCLVGHVTRNELLAATAVLFVLCVGSFARGQGLLAFFGGMPQPHISFPFLRRYEPALPFPLFFLFCFLLWKVLTAKARKTVYASIAGATITFGVLVFSYYFLWTGAVALLGSLVLVLLIVRPDNFRVALRRLAVLTGLCGLILLPYFVLIRGRHEAFDIHTALTLTHTPDFRPVCLFAFVLLVGVAWMIRKKVAETNAASVFTLAVAAAPLVMLNQQVVTGRSLQPQHYEMFVANYLVLLTVVLGIGLFSPGRLRKQLIAALLVCLTLVSLLAGIYDASLASGSRLNRTVDEFMPVALRLDHVSTSKSETVLVMHPAPHLSDVLPSVARVAVLWAPHSFSFSGLNRDEIKRRYFQYLYYSNSNFDTESQDSYARKMFRQNVFGWERTIRGLTANWQPVTTEEEERALREYASYAATFDREEASHPELTYVITPAEAPPSLWRVSLWYDIGEVERVGEFILYRVKLKH